jgi:UDP-N-acetyl-D-mannosaminuronate dehydrogenase
MTSSETREGRRSRAWRSPPAGFQAAVAVLGLAEIGLGVEVDVAEDAFELGLVGVLDVVQHDVDQLADVGRLAALVEVGQEAVGDLAGLLVLELDVGQDEALALQLAADALLVVAVLLR